MEIVADTAEGEAPQNGSSPALVVEIAILSVREGRLAALLCRSSTGGWMLPHQVPSTQETLDDTAICEVDRVTACREAFVRQLYTWGDPEDPGANRILQVSYVALVPAGPPDGLAFKYRWWDVRSLPNLETRHERVLGRACEYLRERLHHTHLAWSLLPEQFTLSELQAIYETIQERALDKRNFRKWLLGTGLVEATGGLRCEGAHRPARLYRFTTREPRLLD
jgi:8-oxo-dGTP diphosphatase